MVTSSRPHIARLTLPCLVALLSLAVACRASPGRGPLREATVPDRIQVKESLPHPFSQLTPGVFTRTIYRGAQSDRLAVEVRDFEIAPQRTTESLTLEGPSLLAVRAGGGLLTVGQQRREITPGLVVSVPQGTPFQVENREDRPVTIRVYLVTAR